MKAKTLFTSPYLLIAGFLLLLISGEHLGGFYLLYLLLALPHGGIHALLAIGGILCLVMAHRLASWQNQGYLKLGGAFIGVILLFASVYTFFYNDKAGYNNGTFEQTVPLVSFIVTGVLALLFLLFNLNSYLKQGRPRGNLIT